MKRTAIAAAFALGSTLAFAQYTGTQTPRGQGQGQQDVPSSQPSARSGAANDYWERHAQEGYMTREDAMGYRWHDGRAADFDAIDTDGDGRVSQGEWLAYSGARR